MLWWYVKPDITTARCSDREACCAFSHPCCPSKYLCWKSALRRRSCNNSSHLTASMPAQRTIEQRSAIGGQEVPGCPRRGPFRAADDTSFKFFSAAICFVCMRVCSTAAAARDHLQSLRSSSVARGKTFHFWLGTIGPRPICREETHRGNSESSCRRSVQAQCRTL